MTNTPPKQQPGLQDFDDGDSINSTYHVRKRDKFRQFLGIPTSTNKELKNKASNHSLNAGRTPQAIGPSLLASFAAGPPSVTSQPKGTHSDNDKVISSGAPADKPLPTPPPALEAKETSAIFLENVSKPSMTTA
ncbi:hypothetical protein BGW39_003756, partial [Mortierella sp. 14UC]